MTSADTGLPGTENRRYGGPCSLRVSVDGNPRYMLDESPGAETQYRVRFYVYLDQAGPDAFPILSAGGGGENVIEIWYNQPEEGQLEFRFLDASSTYQTVVFTEAGSGWHSVEVVWDAGTSVTVTGSLDGIDQSSIIDTGSRQIDWARLGIADSFASTSPGHVDFDDFESRRQNRPGRLLRGDANGDSQIDSLDAQAIYDESAGAELAFGQPDCNEDGAINVLDALCVFELIATAEQFNGSNSQAGVDGFFDIIFADRFEEL